MSDPTDDLWRQTLADADFWSELLDDEEFWRRMEPLSINEAAEAAMARIGAAAARLEDTREMFLIRAELFGAVAVLVHQVGRVRAKEMLAERRH